MNITEFAAYAGVSKAAVSRFFNGGYLSAEKKAAIAKAVEETGYRPSMQAQMMRTRRTKQLGVILPKLSSESCARMVEGISRVLDEQGYQLLLVNTANDNTREVRAMDMLRHDAVDGSELLLGGQRIRRRRPVAAGQQGRESEQDGRVLHGRTRQWL